MIRSRLLALFTVLLLVANPVLACCGALHELAQEPATVLVDKPPCHAQDTDQPPAPEPCDGCPGCEMALTGSDLPVLTVTAPADEFTALPPRSQGDASRDAWLKNTSSTGPPAAPLTPADTPVRRHQLLLL